jgi:hypothetical protein
MRPEVYIVTELSERVVTERTPTRPNGRNKMRDTGTLVTRVIRLQVTQDMHNYRVIRPFSNVSPIPARSDNSVTIYTSGRMSSCHVFRLSV